jgi:hypothetical protein
MKEYIQVSTLSRLFNYKNATKRNVFSISRKNLGGKEGVRR